MNRKTKETLVAVALGAAAGYYAPELFKPKGRKVTSQRWWIAAAGAAAGALFIQSHDAERYGLGRLHVGRSVPVTHPMHPYANGVPAVWGGRQIQY
jgi:hypothetical protein